MLLSGTLIPLLPPSAATVKLPATQHTTPATRAALVRPRAHISPATSCGVSSSWLPPDWTIASVTSSSRWQKKGGGSDITYRCFPETITSTFRGRGQLRALSCTPPYESATGGCGMKVTSLCFGQDKQEQLNANARLTRIAHEDSETSEKTTGGSLYARLVCHLRLTHKQVMSKVRAK